MTILCSPRTSSSAGVLERDRVVLLAYTIVTRVPGLRAVRRRAALHEARG